ncbi:MAG: metallophosphoesterase [Candidatus Bathyarchaeota archaeon]|nr:metallophosphoesterase [Candidatus Bathyarchaeota archaeon]MDW8040841.1 metallophosphoesterase [Nitrososphaerota archaeon]
MITPLTPHPAALVKTKESRTLVVADLHIGWEIALSEKGIHVPTQALKLLEKLKNLIKTYNPDKLLILGDVKHTVATAELGEWQDVPEFFNELKKYVNEVQIIRGNHDGNLDPLLPEGIKILPSSGVVIDGAGFFHGHRWPPPAILKCKTLVMGHVHPVIVLRDPAGFRITRQVWVKAKCNQNQLAEILLQRQGIKIEGDPQKTLLKHYRVKPRTTQLFIMPSFNEFLGGKPLNEKETTENEKIVGPILRAEAVDLRNAEIYLLDGTFLGYLSQLEVFGMP